MKFSYSTNFYPPMPTMQVEFGYPEEAFASGPWDAIVDTGADGSIVPQDLIEEISAPIIDEIRVRGQWGEWRQMMLYTVDIGVGDIRLPAIEVIGDPGQDVILGRNFLNRIKILLDGPANEIELIG